MEIDKSITRARALAGRQQGLIAWQQLMALAIPSRTASAWIACGSLVRVLPRVYSLEHRAATVERDLFATVLFAGPGAMLSHATAAWWWGLIDKRPSAQFEVSTSRHVRSVSGVRVFGRRRLERTVERDLPVTTPNQTLLDLAASQEERLVRRALAVLDYRRELELDALSKLCGQGKPGSAALRQALRIHQPRLAYTNGPLEEDFFFWCERYRVPIPLMNVYLFGIKVDAYWPADALVVELDGGPAHSSRGQRRVDKRKELKLREHGIDVIRYDWDLLHDEPERIHADLTGRLPGTLSADLQEVAYPGTNFDRRRAAAAGEEPKPAGYYRLWTTESDQGDETSMSAPSEPLIPGPDHPITVAPFSGRVRVTYAKHTVADTGEALELREASYPPVYYLPLADVDHGALRPSETTSQCPYKGKATYYDVIDPHTLQAVEDAVWHYREPYAAVGAIANYVAFYPDKVELELTPGA